MPVMLEPANATGTTILISDEGRARESDAAAKALSAGRRVLAIGLGCAGALLASLR